LRCGEEEKRRGDEGMTTGDEDKRHGDDEKPQSSIALSTVFLALSPGDMDATQVEEDTPL